MTLGGAAVEPLVHIKDFRMDFADKTVIKDLSFDVRAGETFGLLGSNGSGKTTTLRALLGIYQPAAGTLHIGGKPFTPRDLSNSSTAASADAQKTASMSFTYTDDSGLIDGNIAAALGGRTAGDPGVALQDVKKGLSDAYFAYPAEPAKQPVKVYGADKGMFENKYDAVAKQLLTASAQAKVGSQQLTAAASGDVKTESQTFRDGQQAGGIGSVVPPLIFLLVFYVSIILLSSQMLSSTLEEKENRVTEMILRP